MRLLRSAFVIARRDFVATVMSRSFLLFLLGPLFPVAMVGLFGSLSGQMPETAQHPLIAVVATETDYQALESARQDLGRAFPTLALARFAQIDPASDAALQRQSLLNSRDPAYLGVLDGGLQHPLYTGSVQPDASTPGQLELIVDHARRPASATAKPPLRTEIVKRSSGQLQSNRALTAQAGQMILFLLTILLAGMLLSQLIEEKSNKVIEVLAAAVPIDSIFLGKLMAMLAMSLLGIAVWTVAGAAAIAVLADNGLHAITPPAVGWPVFLALTFAYFAMSYLLLGSVFLGIGAQASTVREVQTLSMPVTMAQVLIFGLAATAVGKPDDPMALGAAIFPLSSPYVMIARAAERPELWPHAVAIAWQMLWVAVILAVGARLFRRSVLKSGPSKRWWKRSART